MTPEKEFFSSLLEQGPIPLDRTIYPDACLQAALHAEWLGEDHCTRTVDVVIHPAYAAQASEVRKAFLNYMLDLATQHHLKA